MKGRGARGGSCPSGEPHDLAAPGEIGAHPRFRNTSIRLQLRQPGDENGDPLGLKHTELFSNPKPDGRSLIGWGSRTMSEPPGDDRVSSPDHKSLHTSTTPITWGGKGLSPGSKPPRTVRKPQPRRRLAAARDQSQGYPGTIRPHSRIRNAPIHLQLQQPGDENGDPPGRNCLVWCGNPSSTSQSLIGWVSYIAPACPRGENVPSPQQKSFYISATPLTRGRKRRSLGSVPPRKVLSPQPHWLVID